MPRGRFELPDDAVDHLARQAKVEAGDIGFDEFTSRAAKAHRKEIRKATDFRICTVADSELGEYAPRSSYVAFAVLTDQLAGRDLDAREETPEGVRSYRYTGKGKGEDDAVRVMWAPEGDQRITLDADNPVEVTDTMGTTTLQPENGKVTLQLTGDVVYVRDA